MMRRRSARTMTTTRGEPAVSRGVPWYTAGGNLGLPPFRYRDHGALVSLGHRGALGSLMGFVRGKGIRIQGFVAKLMYWSLYRSHRVALQGFWKAALDTVTRLLRRQTDPGVKLR